MAMVAMAVAASEMMTSPRLGPRPLNSRPEVSASVPGEGRATAEGNRSAVRPARSDPAASLLTVSVF